MTYKLIIFLFNLVILTVSVNAQTIEALKNDREDGSYFKKQVYSENINQLKVSFDKQFVMENLSVAIKEAANFSTCILDLSFQVQKNLNNSLQAKDFFLLARSYNLIDDFILELALKTSHISFNPADFRQINIDKNSSLFDFFSKSKRSCLLSNWQSYVQQIKGKKKSLRKSRLKKNIRAQVDLYSLSTKTKSSLIELVSLNLHKENIASLKKYQRTKSKLREKYPLKESDYSKFIIQKRKKSKTSKRNFFYSVYDHNAISAMSQVMTRLIEHVEAPSMVLNIYGENDNLIRSVPFLPMDRFRFAIRYLRQEMNKLQLNPNFNGRSPSYEDIIIAAFETGIIKSQDIDQFSDMEELWNPNKTFLEKSMVWIRAFVPVATILIPPPYNIVASLAVIIIEITTQKPKPEYGHALFKEL